MILSNTESTGREYFHLDWLKKHVTQALKPEDIQATLLALTAKSITNAIDSYPIKAKKVFLCGGGVHNRHLVQFFKTQNKNLEMLSTESAGLHPDWIEAAAFAWLARQTLAGKPGNIPTVTGARNATVLGAIYPKN